MSLQLRSEGSPTQPSAMDMLVGDLELMGQIAYRSGIKSNFPLWHKAALMQTGSLGESFVKGKVSINEAIASIICCNIQGALFRSRVLKEVLRPEDETFLKAKPAGFQSLIRSKGRELKEDGDGGLLLFEYSGGARMGMVGLLMRTRIPHVQYRFDAYKAASGYISIEEELVTGKWPTDMGPHSLKGANRFSY